jgi:hypothetical protein
VTEEKKVLAPGDYLANIVGGAIHTDDKGTQIGVQFQLQGRTDRVWWYGPITGERAEFLFEKSNKTKKQYTFETLVTIGLNEQKVMEHPEASESFRFDTAYFLDPKKLLNLSVTNYQGKDGKIRVQVDYVNDANGGKFGKVEPKLVKASLATAGFLAEMAIARKNSGQMPIQAQETAAPKFDENENIPF